MVVLVAVVEEVRVAVLAAARCNANSSIAVGLHFALGSVHGQSPGSWQTTSVQDYRGEDDVQSADPPLDDCKCRSK